MNVLGLSAAFGLLVLIFQDGRLRGAAQLPQPGRARADAAGAPLRDRVRARDRLRRLPALADQGGARRRPREPGGGRARARTDRAGRHLGRAALLRRRRRVRDVVDRDRQGGRHRDRARRRDRRDARPGAPRAEPDGSARRLELVARPSTWLRCARWNCCLREVGSTAARAASASHGLSFERLFRL